MMEIVAALVVGICIGWFSFSPRQNMKESFSDSYVCFDEGRTQRCNGHGGPYMPKPKIVPYGQGYQPNPSSNSIYPPPRNP
jgi:hypothetical protein